MLHPVSRYLYMPVSSPWNPFSTSLYLFNSNSISVSQTKRLSHQRAFPNLTRQKASIFYVFFVSWPHLSNFYQGFSFTFTVWIFDRCFSPTSFVRSIRPQMVGFHATLFIYCCLICSHPACTLSKWQRFWNPASRYWEAHKVADSK